MKRIGRTRTLGRESKVLKPGVKEKVLAALRLGSYRRLAALHAGVAPETLTKWMLRGENEPRSIYAAFRQEVMAAESQAELLALHRIQKAADTDPKHAEWWLARKRPDEWADRSKIKVDAVVTSPALADLAAALGAIAKPATNGHVDVEPEDDGGDGGDVES